MIVSYNSVTQKLIILLSEKQNTESTNSKGLGNERSGWVADRNQPPSMKATPVGATWQWDPLKALSKGGKGNSALPCSVVLCR